MGTEKKGGFISPLELCSYCFDIFRSYFKEMFLLLFFLIIVNGAFQFIEMSFPPNDGFAINIIKILPQLISTSITIIIVYVVKCYFEDNEVNEEDVVDFVKSRLPLFLKFFAFATVVSFFLVAAAFILTVVTFGTFIIVVLVAAIPVSLALMFVTECIVFFASGPIDAIKQSDAISKGYRLHLFAYMFVLFLILFGVMFLILLSAFKNAQSMEELRLITINPFVNVILNSVVTLLYRVISAVLFLSIYELNTVNKPVQSYNRFSGSASSSYNNYYNHHGAMSYSSDNQYNSTTNLKSNLIHQINNVEDLSGNINLDNILNESERVNTDKPVHEQSEISWDDVFSVENSSDNMRSTSSKFDTIPNFESSQNQIFDRFQISKEISSDVHESNQVSADNQNQSVQITKEDILESNQIFDNVQNVNDSFERMNEIQISLETQNTQNSFDEVSEVNKHFDFIEPIGVKGIKESENVENIRVSQAVQNDIFNNGNFFENTEIPAQVSSQASRDSFSGHQISAIFNNAESPAVINNQTQNDVNKTFENPQSANVMTDDNIAFGNNRNQAFGNPQSVNILNNQAFESNQIQNNNMFGGNQIFEDSQTHINPFDSIGFFENIEPPKREYIDFDMSQNQNGIFADDADFNDPDSVNSPFNNPNFLSNDFDINLD